MRGRKPFILSEDERPVLRKKVLAALRLGKKTAITGMIFGADPVFLAALAAKGYQLVDRV